MRTYGRLIAQVHILADDMPFRLARPANDIEQIVSRSMAAFETEVSDRPATPINPVILNPQIPFPMGQKLLG